MKIYLTTLFLSQILLLGFSQEIVVEGKISAFNKFPLPNIEVLAKKSKNKIITDENGNFRIEIKKKDVLKINNPLFHSFEEKVTGETGKLNINLIFEENDKNIREAISKGYFSEEELDYALTNLAKENNIYGLFNNVYEAIKYAIPEASMVESQSGTVGFILRGTNSIKGSNLAMYVVNQNIVGDVSFINTTDICKIYKLPTSQSAMYGSRAGNGVICIETF
ncbi:carboxypeptidase-like regulatory domain-containing protein [uncultured Draconibacterium sp.]|uniref:carboxypeptidase-like regulatory domain-containing protein n=1 Tax=uncultured Draconibacterium sp. TaxID=1573823 RepID=UPI0029C6224B|nr:carboxypeptidase-like regulatory domain-containing protein [uncultured Draconibacterium sp.]